MTGIQWTDETWNVATGCTKVSAGCARCYAERVFPRAYGRDEFIPHGAHTGRRRRFTDVRLHPERLEQPLRMRKPKRFFTCSMSDLFHEDVPDEFIDQVFAVMALSPQHTFQVLTKRPERMREWVIGSAGRVVEEFHCRDHWRVLWSSWPLPNVWLGVSAEDQATADERVPILLDTPAAVRFVSAEPLLGPVDLSRFAFDRDRAIRDAMNGPAAQADSIIAHPLDWVICGGESGPKARPCNAAWIRSIVEQCKAAGVACFVKQLGAKAWQSAEPHSGHAAAGVDPATEMLNLRLRDRKGGDPNEWPEDLRVREFPAVEVRT